jgi:hypothetical protein
MIEILKIVLEFIAGLLSGNTRVTVILSVLIIFTGILVLIFFPVGTNQ